MKTLSAYFHRRASMLTLGIAFILYLLFPAMLLPKAEKAIDQAAGRHVGIIDLGIGFDLDTIHQQVAAYGPAGRDLYRRTEVTMDIAYPLIYTLFFTLLITLLMRRLPLGPRLRQANILPFAMLGFDLLENVCIVALLRAYPAWSETTALLCATFRLLKWLTFAATAGLILFLIGKRMFAGRTVDGAKAA